MNREERLAIISRCALFQGLALREREDIARFAIEKHYEAGATIFRQGDLAKYLIIVVRGSIRISMCSASGRELLIRIAGHGDIIGEFTLMKDGQHPTDCITQEKTQTLTIAQRALLVAANDISFYSRLTALLFHKLQSTLTTLEDLALASLEVRLARLLLRLHDSDRNRSPAQLQGLNQGQIAMMANATRPKVNQQLQRFRKAGAIDIRAGTVTVRDTNVLEGISLKST